MRVSAPVCAQTAANQIAPTTIVSYYDADDNKLFSAENACYKTETIYSDSIKGTETRFDMSGKPVQSIRYSNVRRQIQHGEAIIWHPNGKVRARENYANGKRHGELLVYYPSGRLKRRDFYAQDKFVKGQCFGSTGKLIKHTPYVSLPTYEGGVEGILRYISSNMEYPIAAIRNAEEGKVLVSFLVDSKGLVKNVRVVQSLSTLTDAEAVRVVQTLKRFTPGTRDGEAVPVHFTIPITFAIQ